LNHLILSLLFQGSEFGVIDPMNAVYWAGVDCLLDHLFRITILTNDARATIIWLNVKGIAGNMGAVFAANAGNFIDVNSSLANDPP
jgi:hypothetical protein